MRRRVLLSALATLPVAGLAGCTEGGGSQTPTPTPTPPSREFPYTAASPAANLHPRDLTLNNGTGQSYEASVTISDLGTERTVLDRTVSVQGESGHTFDEIIGKKGTYSIAFELAVGTAKRYKWPIDEAHGNASIAIREGDSPTDPVVWFSITNL